jgi:hypothetical protein
MVVGAGSVGAAVLLRRRTAARRDRVDLYLADGTKVVVGEGSPELARLLPLAHDVLHAAS